MGRVEAARAIEPLGMLWAIRYHMRKKWITRSSCCGKNTGLRFSSQPPLRELRSDLAVPLSKKADSEGTIRTCNRGRKYTQ